MNEPFPLNSITYDELAKFYIAWLQGGQKRTLYEEFQYYYLLGYKHSNGLTPGSTEEVWNQILLKYGKPT